MQETFYLQFLKWLDQRALFLYLYLLLKKFLRIVIYIRIDYLVSNLCSYELIKEFTSEDFNQEITVFSISELPVQKEKRFITEVVVTASYDFSVFGRARTTVIKVALYVAQNQGKEIYNIGLIDDKAILKYDWWTGSIKAALKDTKIYFKVYALKYFN